MRLGLFLKQYRKAVSLSGQSLSRRIGVSRHSLEKWENTASLPNYKSAIKLQRYFGLERLDDIPESHLQLCIARSLQKPVAVDKKNQGSTAGPDDYFQTYFTNLLAEKDQRIRELEQFISVLKVQNKKLKNQNL